MEEPTIICPKCKNEIKLTESLAAPYRIRNWKAACSARHSAAICPTQPQTKTTHENKILPRSPSRLRAPGCFQLCGRACPHHLQPELRGRARYGAARPETGRQRCEFRRYHGAARTRLG